MKRAGRYPALFLLRDKMLRKITRADFPEVLTLLTEGKKHLKEKNIPQWQDGYPNEETILNDFNQKQGYVWMKAGKILGYGVLLLEEEKSYEEITGKWLTEKKAYGTIHRFTVKQGSRASDEFLQALEALGKSLGKESIRIDTHEKNTPMKKLLQRNNYFLCGKIRLWDTKEERIALEKIL